MIEDDDASARREADPDSFAARGESEFDRGLSFYDAIYGFAATLLVTNIDAPAADDWRSLGALLSAPVVDQLVAFAISFIVIVVFWRVNVGLVRRLRGLDGPTNAINLVGVGLVILLPFTTQGISDAATTELPLPTAVYAVNVAAVSVAQIAMYQVARSRGLERVRTTTRANRVSLIDGLVTPVYFLASVPVALLAGADAARWFWLGLAPVAVISGRWASRAARDAGAGGVPSRDPNAPPVTDR